MQAITTVTQKGQITLPKSLRELVNIDLFDKVIVKLGKGYLRVEPTKDILDLAGKYRAKKGQSALKARELMEREYTRV
ncbi:MAG: Transcriptional regulator, AbrB family [Candidatus Beckwithbacteria bacterium GW2011_GWB1_47_15]|uniref:Transcriptional regulator, AbrB family n=1 Tax=Candidatus Beckwithbacteria bacterium GW2011_GWB1_47_15 TaxID=1618371 RepID=A0A0G1RWA0_9BACT|nr:MAG: hypothetical protein UY43_C0001G0404 [Candidatus Beckwithbacteria bacterium GW2011_GWC1_49_16]KKU35306.1 MAG: Transcriptional regulator, AbrB family [Candidatus Beckwithbacteria bacterium GW2011_GWA1_46_30]KKU61401.1 MAG: Transcriptional regulator, AbrB family [Candidatus Beckwithbacteria bacterium GW2011_GWB1_47_15]KKU71808.1 MAG: Transcriptional regulator, AbrB family [Candidatus Beckwithbacteria bacterium GW2011_GWA2_47_25]KKW03041.1 MAG: Transcriptional regulator, AbrB family [Candi